MFEPKTVTGDFPWISPERRKSPFGPMPPRRKETRTPLLRLARQAGELFLVNSSSEVIHSVSASSTGWLRLGHEEGVLPLEQPRPCVTYQNVSPYAAVKVDEYDDAYDLDFDLGLNLIIHSQGLGSVEFQTTLHKGGLPEIVLLWNTGDLGSDVIKPLI